MNAANARLKSLHAAVGRVGAGIKKMALLFGGLFSLFGTFLAANVFSKIFGSAQDEAVEAEQRTRSLLDSLMQMNEIRKKGPAEAQKQLDLIYQHNKALEAQGVLHKDILDVMSVELAAGRIPSKDVQDTVDVMQNLLIKTRGVKGATEEAAKAMADKFVIAARKGTIKGLGLGIAPMTPAQAKAFKEMSFPERVHELIRLGKAVGDLNKQSRGTPIGRIQLFNNAMKDLSQELGNELLPAQAELADSWRKALPELKPILLSTMKGLMWAAKKLGEFVTNTLLPAWAEFRQFAATTLAPILDTIKAKFDYMVSMVGPAFAKMLGFTAENGRTWKTVFGDALVKVLTLLGDTMVWVGDNADTLVPLLKNLGVAFVALSAFVWAFNLAAAVNPLTWVVVAVVAVGLLATNWERLGAIVGPTLETMAKKPPTPDPSWNNLSITFAQSLLDLAKNMKIVDGFFLRLRDTAVQAFKDMVDNLAKFDAPFKAVGETIRTVLLAPIHALKAIWDGLVTSITSFKLPEWAGGAKAQAAGTDYGQNVSTGIPQFAAGGIITKPTVAMVGEAGPEAIIPLNNTMGALALTNFTDVLHDLSPVLTKFVDALEKSPLGQTFGAAHSAFSAAFGGAAGAMGGPAGVAGGASALPQLPLSTEALAKIADERKDIIKELQKPELQNLVSATLSTEMSSAEGQKDVLEALVNRSVAYKKAGKYSGIENMIKGGFYGPYNRGETNAVMRAGMSPARQAQVADMIEQTKTRNALRGMTDQGEVPSGYTGPVAKMNGELYSYAHGYGGAAYTESQKAAETAKLAKFATGGVVGKPTLSLIGEKGPEAVVPLNKLNAMRGGGDTAVHFAPNITVNGNMTDADQKLLDSRLRDLARDFVSHFKRAQTHERRLSYEGGYG
jgi:hypothetical protein